MNPIKYNPLKKFRWQFLVFALIYTIISISCENKSVLKPKHTVPLERAVATAGAFKKIAADPRNIQARSNSVYFTCERFSREDIEAILNEDDCTGIRLYHALDSSGKAIVYIVGVKGNKDLLPSKRSENGKQKPDSSFETSKYYYIIESDGRCPDSCPEDGGL